MGFSKFPTSGGGGGGAVQVGGLVDLHPLVEGEPPYLNIDNGAILLQSAFPDLFAALNNLLLPDINPIAPESRASTPIGSDYPQASAQCADNRMAVMLNTGSIICHDLDSDNAQVEATGLSSTWVGAAASDPENSRAALAGYECVYVTTNSGNSWSQRNHSGTERSEKGAYLPNSGGVLFAATKEVVYSTNWSSFNSVSPSALSTNNQDLVGVWEDETGICLMTRNGDLYKNTSLSVSDTNYSFVGSKFTSYYSIFHASGPLIVGLSNNGMALSTDYGVTWTQTGLPDSGDYDAVGAGKFKDGIAIVQQDDTNNLARILLVARDGSLTVGDTFADPFSDRKPGLASATLGISSTGWMSLLRSRYHTTAWRYATYDLDSSFHVPAQPGKAIRYE